MYLSFTNFEQLAPLLIGAGFLILLTLLIVMSTIQKNSAKRIYLLALSGLGVIIFTFGAVRLVDTFLRHNVFDLPVYGVSNCEMEADDSWVWRWRDQQFDIFDQPVEEMEKPSDEEIEAFKKDIAEKCETRREMESRNWAAARYSQAATFLLVGGILWLVHYIPLRRCRNREEN